MFHLILNDNCRNPLFIILEYILFVLFERIPCNMNMDPYCRDHCEIPTYIQATNPSTCFWCFSFPCSHVVQPLLRSSFGIKIKVPSAMGPPLELLLLVNLCHLVTTVYSCIYPHIPTTY